ncbi:MAG: hypothetical protein ACW98X_25760 [Promethearchaeota archaeon]|jgi:hypothetical protein
MSPIRQIEWEIAKGKVLESQKNTELAQMYGISYENNVSRIFARFIEKIEQTEKDLVQAIELGLYEPTLLEIKEKPWQSDERSNRVHLDKKKKSVKH